MVSNGIFENTQLDVYFSAFAEFSQVIGFFFFGESNKIGDFEEVVVFEIETRNHNLNPHNCRVD